MGPLFNTARGAATLTTAPPFDFSGVVMRTFPLRARMWALRQFCHRYLNVAPQIVEFEPAMPFVFLQMLSYGKMSTEAQAGGWVSQHELLFSIPVLWYRIDAGERVLHDIGTVTPYVFVDQPSSQTVGREVYGWPKVLGWLDPGVSAWVESPREPLDLVMLSTMVMPEKGTPRPMRLVEIRRHPRPAIADVPPEWDDPLNPFATIPQAVSGGVSLAAELLEMLTALPIRGYDPDFANVPQMLARFFSSAPAAERPAFNTINLKQFRAAADPSRACFQALTNAQMTLTSFNRGGLLGEARQLQGDLSGGYRLRIFRYPSMPLVETLGLQEDEEHDALADAPFADLHPLTPFWVDVDFLYGRGEEICWRGGDGIWHQGERTVPLPEPPSPTLYNTARGGVGETFGGPFSFPNATMRVLPLLADPGTLQGLVDGYLNQVKEGPPLPSDTRFKVWGSYVYLLVASHEATALGIENLRLGLQRSASFIIPLLWYDEDGLRSPAILRAYVYSDSDAGAITGQEVQGWPIVVAHLDSPVDPWMGPSGPAVTDRGLLVLETDLLQSLGLGQQAELRRLVEIGTRPVFPEADQPAWEEVAARWGEQLLAELERKCRCRADHPLEFLDALALSLAPLALGRPIEDVALRQFRDVHNPDRACYQGLSLSRTVLENVSDLCEIDGVMHVGIHRYASAPIVQSLGLVVKASQTTAGSTIDWLQPIRPFWMRLGMKTLLGQDLFFRIHTERWTEAPVPLAAAAAPGFQVGPGLVDYIDESEFRRRHLAEAVKLWSGKPLDSAEATRAIETIEPQVVIEALLSRGWGSRGLPLFWRRETDHDRRRPVPDFCVPSRSLGPFSEQFEKLHPELHELQGYWYLQAREDPARPKKGRHKDGKSR